MKTELSEVDMIIHWARQSKMADLRKELEKLVKQKDKHALYVISNLFKKASNNAPLP